MVLGTWNLFPVGGPHGEKRRHRQGGGDENLEELGITVQGDHAPKARCGAVGQEPDRDQGSGQRREDRPDDGRGSSPDAACYENEGQGHADQDQLRDQQDQVRRGRTIHGVTPARSSATGAWR